MEDSVFFCLIYIPVVAAWAAKNPIRNYSKPKWQIVVGIIFIVIGVGAIIAGTANYGFPPYHLKADACWIGWGIYLIRFIPSNIPSWKKVIKVVGYILCTFGLWGLFWEATWMHDDFSISVCIALLISIVLIRISRFKKKQKQPTIMQADYANFAPETANHSVAATQEASFKQTTDKVLFWLSMVFLVASVVFFCLFVDRPSCEEYLFLWLGFSLLSAVFIGVAYYLNAPILLFEQKKKWVVWGLICGLILLVPSPFFGITALVCSFLLLKQVY